MKTMHNRNVVKVARSVIELLQSVGNTIIEKGYSNDSRLLQDILGKVQMLKSRWEKVETERIKTAKAGHWSGPSKAYVENKGAEHVD